MVTIHITRSRASRRTACSTESMCELLTCTRKRLERISTDSPALRAVAAPAGSRDSKNQYSPKDAAKMASPCSTLFANVRASSSFSPAARGGRLIISSSAGCRSSTTEQVGSIISSSSTTCSGSSIRLSGAAPNSGASREERAIGMCMVKTYPTALRILS